MQEEDANTANDVHVEAQQRSTSAKSKSTFSKSNKTNPTLQRVLDTDEKEKLASTSSTKPKRVLQSKKRCAPDIEPARRSKRFDSDSEDEQETNPRNQARKERATTVLSTTTTSQPKQKVREQLHISHKFLI